MRERGSLAVLALITAALSIAALAHIPATESARTLAAPARPRGVPTALATRALRDGEPIDLNRAAEADLELLPGVGPALAHRIVVEREAHGPFVELEALRRVHGLGPRTLERMRKLVTVGRGGEGGRGTR